MARTLATKITATVRPMPHDAWRAARPPASVAGAAKVAPKSSARTGCLASSLAAVENRTAWRDRIGVTKSIANDATRTRYDSASAAARSVGSGG